MLHDSQVNLIIANEITPHLTAEEYMDKGEYENELKQVRWFVIEWSVAMLLCKCDS